MNGCENVSTVGLKKFLASLNCSSLVVLDVSWLKIDNALFDILANHSNLQLKRLSMAGVDNCWDNLERFLDTNNFESLEHLDLSFSTVK